MVQMDFFHGCEKSCVGRPGHEARMYQCTVDQENFVVNKFSSVPYNDEKNIFQHRIIRTKLHFWYAEVMKIKQQQTNIFTSENFPIIYCQSHL